VKAKITRLDEFKKMPPLHHKTTEPFDHLKSEVMAWAIRQPVVCEYLFSIASRYGLIVFDKTTKTWQGRDYKAQTTTNPFDNL